MTRGRPSKSPPDRLVTVSARIPARLAAEINRQASALPGGIVGRKSVVVRRLIEVALGLPAAVDQEK